MRPSAFSLMVFLLSSPRLSRLRVPPPSTPERKISLVNNYRQKNFANEYLITPGQILQINIYFRQNSISRRSFLPRVRCYAGRLLHADSLNVLKDKRALKRINFTEALRTPARTNVPARRENFAPSTLSFSGTRHGVINGRDPAVSGYGPRGFSSFSRCIIHLRESIFFLGYFHATAVRDRFLGPISSAIFQGD